MWLAGLPRHRGLCHMAKESSDALDLTLMQAADGHTNISRHVIWDLNLGGVRIPDKRHETTSLIMYKVGRKQVA